MSTHEDLLATIRYVRDRTGDPNAWQTGLTPTEVTAVVTSTTRSEQLDAILRKIRQRHSNLYYPAPPDREQGDAARAIADAEAALAHQNSATAQLDLQVVSAILNAHLKTVEGGESLHELQQEIEAAVRIRSDLDTPAGARDFQRFLIGKLKDIREVVATASLDAASKSALMAAWTSLYDASKGDRGDADDRGPASVGSGGAPARGAGQQPELPTRAEPDCLLDSLLLEDPGLLADDLQVPGGTSAAIPSASSTPSLPNLGGATMPGGGATPALVPGVSAPGGLPLSGLLRGVGDEPELTDFDERGQEVRDPADYEHSNEPDERRADDREGADEDAGLGKSESPPQAPTTVTLPNGETVTAASPQLAAAIKAAASGTPIADAFQQQGIAIPLPGTAVANPVDSARISAGDVGVFTATPLPLALAKPTTCGPCRRRTTRSAKVWTRWGLFSVSSATPGVSCSSSESSATSSKPTTTPILPRTCERRPRCGSSTSERRRAASATSLTGADDRAMTDANPAFDTVHPSGHILVRSCRGGYMHSVSLSEAAMETDAETLAEAILLTADVSCLKALLEVRNEIVAAGHTPSAQVPTTDDLNVAIEKLLAHQLRRRNR